MYIWSVLLFPNTDPNLLSIGKCFKATVGSLSNSPPIWDEKSRDFFMRTLKEMDFKGCLSSLWLRYAWLVQYNCIFLISPHSWLLMCRRYYIHNTHIHWLSSIQSSFSRKYIFSLINLHFPLCLLFIFLVRVFV